MCREFLSEKLKGRDHAKYLDVDEKVINNFCRFLTMVY
jgi:hypothetical protein